MRTEMTAHIENLKRINAEQEEVFVQFEDGSKFAVTRSLFDEHPEDVWKSVNGLHDRWLSQKSFRSKTMDEHGGDLVVQTEPIR